MEVVWLVMRFAFWKSMKSEKYRRTAAQILTRILFLGYCAVMIWLLFGQRLDRENIGFDNLNLIPFATLKLYTNLLQNSKDPFLLRHAFINLVGNVVMFIPLGYFLPALWPRLRQFFSILLSAVAIIVFIELCQYFSNLGSCDVDDFILNIPGVLVGWGIYRLQMRKSS